MNSNIFRKYDIRGVYPTEINENVAYTIGKSYGSYLQEKLNQTTCIVSYDNPEVWQLHFFRNVILPR